MAWTREKKNAYQRALYRKTHPQRAKRGPRPEIKQEEKPILPQSPFSALYTQFFIDRNPKK